MVKTLLALWACTAVVGYGCSIISFKVIWAKKKSSSAPFFRIVQDGKVGFINASGVVVIPAQFDLDANETGDFVDGLACVRKDGKWGYIDEKTNWVIEPQFNFCHDFKEGFFPASVADWNGKRLEFRYGYVGRFGQFAIEPKFEVAGDFSEGLAPVQIGEKWGYIDPSGSFAIAPQFAFATGFSEGLARVVLDGYCWYIGNSGWRIAAPSIPRDLVSSCGEPPDNVKKACKQGFVDKSGVFVIAPRFDNAGNFSEGFAPVKIDGAWAYIDRAGYFVGQPRFEAAREFSEGRTAVKLDGDWGFIDTSGEIAIKPRFRSVGSFSEGLAEFSEEGKTGFIDKWGTVVIPPKYRFATHFVHGLANVSLGKGRWAYIDKTGEAVFTYQDRDFIAERQK